MRIFVTGATGGIGSAVVPELLTAGHEVLGLARSEASVDALAAVGAEVQRGELADLESLRVAAARSDGVIHLAFSNDFTNLEEGIAHETAAIETLCAALEGSGKPLVIASGTPVVPGRASTEQDPTRTEGPVGGRGRASLAALTYAERGVRVALVRLPRSVHAAGGPCGFASLLVAAARRTGVSGYVADGSQRWPAVHRLDAARLFRLVLEKGEPGIIAHAVGDEGDAMRTIAETIGRELGLPTEEVPTESFGVLGTIFATDQPASSVLTRKRFAWEPTHPNLLDDLRAGNYRTDVVQLVGDVLELGVGGQELDDVVQQAADDALLAIVAKLSEFRGDSRFTTWAYKFAVLKVASKLTRHAWRRAAPSRLEEDWGLLPDRFGFGPAEAVEWGELFALLRLAVDEDLTSHQRHIFVAVVLQGVPLDVLVEELGSNRNAIYKSLFDARRKLRARLVANGYMGSEEMTQR